MSPDYNLSPELVSPQPNMSPRPNMSPGPRPASDPPDKGPIQLTQGRLEVLVTGRCVVLPVGMSACLRMPAPAPIYCSACSSLPRWGPVCDRGFGDQEAQVSGGSQGTERGPGGLGAPCTPSALAPPTPSMPSPALALQVACRTLGLTGGKAVPGAAYGQASVPHKLDWLDCTGAEDSLTHCKYSVRPSCGSHQHDVGVECTLPPDLPVRLAGGPDLLQGRLEVGSLLPCLRKCSWCMRIITHKQPALRCVMLCCRSRLAASGALCAVLALRPQCLTTRCGSMLPALLLDTCKTCLPHARQAAGIVCGKLGFEPRGWAVPGSLYPPSSLPIHIADVRCTGSERELSACRYTAGGAGSRPWCTHAYDIGVACVKPSIGGITL